MKKSLVATAVHAVLAAEALDLAKHSAQLAMQQSPTEEAQAALAQRLVQDLDDALLGAIERHLGHEVEDLSTLAGRLEFSDVQDKPEEGTTYAIDGVPVLWAGPVTMGDSFSLDGQPQMQVHRVLRVLV